MRPSTGSKIAGIGQKIKHFMLQKLQLHPLGLTH